MLFGACGASPENTPENIQKAEAIVEILQSIRLKKWKHVYVIKIETSPTAVRVTFQSKPPTIGVTTKCAIFRTPRRVRVPNKFSVNIDMENMSHLLEQVNIIFLKKDYGDIRDKLRYKSLIRPNFSNLSYRRI